MKVKMRWILPAVVVLAGCGSSWQPRKGTEIEVGCLEKLYYPDFDGDGWGDGSADPITSCVGLIDEGYTATNGRDCDDTDPEITGHVGGLCPDGFVVGSGDYEGLRYDDVEMVFLLGEHTPTVSYAAAESACEDWGPATYAEGSETPTPVATLSTFRSPSELNTFKDAVNDALSGDGLGLFAAFIGMGWSGSFDTATGTFSGTWAWVDGDSTFDLIAADGWCDGPLDPADFFPRLNPLCDGTHPEQCGPCEGSGEPGEAYDCGNHQVTLAEELSRVRLALVRRASGEWCVGLPRDAIPAEVREDLDNEVFNPDASRYAHLTHTFGHFACKRPTPNPNDFIEYTAYLDD